MIFSILILSFLNLSDTVAAQSITNSLPKYIDTTQTYLFYLHGGVVQQQGENAVSKYFGEYRYRDILDTLHSYGYHVISEIRPKDSDEITYANKVAIQIDSLTGAGVPVQNIYIVGASLGAYIALEVANIVRNKNLNVAVIGLCSEYAVDYFSGEIWKFKGHFLSIYESSDQKGSCNEIFSENDHFSSYREIKTRMGNGHAFLYRPYRDWVDPLVGWIERSSN